MTKEEFLEKYEKLNPDLKNDLENLLHKTRRGIINWIDDVGDDLEQERDIVASRTCGRLVDRLLNKEDLQ